MSDTTDYTALTQELRQQALSGGRTSSSSGGAASSVSVTNFPATQPVSGTVTANAGTGTMAVSAASLPLPTGAAQDGTDITSPTAMPAGGSGIRGWLSAIWTKLNGSIAVTGTFWQATQPVSGTVTANAGTGTFAVSAASLPLPSGAAQDSTLTGGNQISQIKTAAKGTTAAGQPTSTAVDANTQALHTNVTNFPATQAVSGTVTVQQSTASSLKVDLSGTAANTTAIKVDGSGVTQPVSGTVTSNIGTGNLAGITGTVTVKADTAANQANALKVDGSAVTQPVSMATNTPDVTDRSGRQLGIVSVTGTVSNDNVEFPAAAALADATANPTTTAVGSENMLFNGTTWDRFRGAWDTTTGDSGTKTATFAGATQTNYNHRGAIITVKLGTVSGTSPTLNATLQWSPDAGTTWLNMAAATSNATATNNTISILAYPTNWSVAGATPAALTLGSTVSQVLNVALPRTWRINYTIGGTSPSFAITAVYVNYLV